MDIAARTIDRVNVLLVDDCVAERNLYELALGREFNILTAGRGDDAVALACLEQPDAIVLDVMMPGMNGWDACAVIKGIPATADIPVIILTGTDDHDLSQHAKAVWASALLRKPCPAEMLRDTILVALKGKGDLLSH